MVFAPTAASIGWQVRREAAHSSSSPLSLSLENRHKEYSSGKGHRSGVRGKEKVKRSDFQTDQKLSKKKCMIDKDSLDVVIGKEGKISHQNVNDNRDRTTLGKTSTNYHDLSDDNYFIAPGVRTERCEGEYHSSILTFDNISHIGNRYQFVAITGTAKVMALQGNVTIFGYTLRSKSGISLALNSPSWTSSICITPCHTSAHNGTQSPSTKYCAKPVTDTVNQLPIKVKITSIISSRNGGRTFRITSPEKVRSHIFISDDWNLAATSILNDVTRHCKENIAPCKTECHGKDPIPVPNHADPVDVSKENRDNATRGTNRNRILVCGAKGVGKSTYLRYLVNRFLSATTNGEKCKKGCNDDNSCVGKVAIIDCDVGQPELSPPGLLSLTIVTKPILSPPNSHIVCSGGGDTYSSTCAPGNDEEGERLFDVADHHCKAYYYGYTSSKADPTSYITTVKALVADYENLCNNGQILNECSNYCDSRIPLIINTDGWVKSMGYEILSSIIGATNPEHIVQILGSSKAKLFELSSHDSNSRKIYNIEAFGHHMGTKGHLALHDVPNMPDSIIDFTLPPQNLQPTNVTNYESSFTEVKDFNSPITSMSLRNLSLCTYFLGGYSSFLRTGATFQTSIVDDDHMISTTLAKMAPFTVPFDAVECTHLDDSVTNGTSNDDENFHNISDSLNCSIVGLCGSKASCKDSYACVGLGIIRGIDWQKKLLYILTPVPACKIVGHVQTIVGGHIQLPIECVNLGVKSESFSFQCCDGISVGIGSGSNPTNKR